MGKKSCERHRKDLLSCSATWTNLFSRDLIFSANEGDTRRKKRQRRRKEREKSEEKDKVSCDSKPNISHSR